jgi:putative oxidoreductase
MCPSLDHETASPHDQRTHLSLVTDDERVATPQRPVPRGKLRFRRLLERLETMEMALHKSLVTHSVALLRISLGVVFLGFGVLKFFPGVSPAENLVIATTSILTLHLVPGSIAIVAIAALECVIGLWLLSGRALRGVLYLLAVELVGILSPLVLLAGRLFGGPHHAPTLEGQYVFKDVILVAAVLVLAATVGGAKLTSHQEAAAGVTGPAAGPQADEEPPTPLPVAMEG